MFYVTHQNYTPMAPNLLTTIEPIVGSVFILSKCEMSVEIRFLVLDVTFFHTRNIMKGRHKRKLMCLSLGCERSFEIKAGFDSYNSYWCHSFYKI